MSQPDDGRGATPAYRDTGGPLAADPPAAAAQAFEPSPRRGGGGFLAGLLGGLLGSAALLAGAGWYAFERGPVRPTLERLAATEAAAREAGTGVQQLGGQVQELRGQVGEVGGAVEAGAGTGRQLDERVGAIDGRVAAVETGLGAIGPLDQRVAALDGRVGAAERTLGELTARLDQASTSFRTASEQVIGRMEEVNARLAEVARAQPAGIVDKGTVDAIAGKQAAVDQAQARLEGSLARVEQLVAGGLEAGNQQAEALRVVVDNNRGRLDDVAAAVAALAALRTDLARQQAVDAEQIQALQATGQQLAAVRTDLERRLEEVATRLGELDRQRERSVATALAVDNLGTALQAGQPFRPALEVLGRFGGEDPVVGGAVGKLEPAAENGVATTAELAGQLDGIERGLSAPQESQPDDWLARTRSNLGGLVDVHPADQEAVPGAGAVQAARQALLVGDLPGAVQALEPLARAGNQEAAAWTAAARTRIEADAALQDLRQHVKTLLARQD